MFSGALEKLQRPASMPYFHLFTKGNKKNTTGHIVCKSGHFSGNKRIRFRGFLHLFLSATGLLGTRQVPHAEQEQDDHASGERGRKVEADLLLNLQ